MTRKSSQSSLTATTCPKFPTDSEGRLIGTIPLEDAIDIMHEEYEEDLSNIHGVQDTSDEDYLERSSFAIAKGRTTWLIICLITATMTGFIIQRYESLLASSVALAAYRSQCLWTAAETPTPNPPPR
ncbi:hypothetical protein [Peptoniphilus asaccharolyticus]